MAGPQSLQLCVWGDNLDFRGSWSDGKTDFCCLVAKSPLILATPWIVAGQAPLSTGFPRQEYWSGLPFPFRGNLPDPGIKLGLLHW